MIFSKYRIRKFSCFGKGRRLVFEGCYTLPSPPGLVYCTRTVVPLLLLPRTSLRGRFCPLLPLPRTSLRGLSLPLPMTSLRGLSLPLPRTSLRGLFPPSCLGLVCEDCWSTWWRWCWWSWPHLPAGWSSGTRPPPQTSSAGSAAAQYIA